MNIEPLFDKAKKIIDQSKNIILVYAANVDPDAFGSVYAFYHYLKKIKKSVKVANYHGNIQSYLKDYSISARDLIKSKATIKNFDLIISFDGASLERIGLEPYLVKDKKIIHFDHHLITEKTQGVLILDHYKAATTELLYEYFKFIKFPISVQMADGLLMGIISDTQNFQHSNVSAQLFETAADLASISNKIYDFNKKYLYKKSITDMKLLGEVLKRMKFLKERGLVLSVLSKEDLLEFGAVHKDLSMASYFLNTTKDAKYSLLLSEKEGGRVKGSLRTEKEKGINVGEIAEVFKGGGHLAAAGFNLKGRIIKTKRGNWQVV